VSPTYLELARQGLERYEFIVYCPLSVFVELDQDPARVTEMTYHLLYDATLWGLLQKFRPRDARLITMPFPNLDHRKDFLHALMKPVIRATSSVAGSSG
jgi:hypothetical protein